MAIQICKRLHNQRVQTCFYLVCMVTLLVSTVGQASAANGLPDSTKFGYGMRIDPWGQEVEFALNIAAQSGLDWISIDFDWQQQWPDASRTLDLSVLNQSMSFAAENGLSVLLSITHPPQWAMTAQGPDPQMTAGLVAQLVRHYPDALKAVELFPGANTHHGWGAQPSPQNYLKLFRSISQTLSTAQPDITLVAAGLVPVSESNRSGDTNDLQFLQALYTAGAAAQMPVVSLRFPALRGDPLAAPWKSEARVLRRYELVRGLMLENEHAQGMIWLTGFTLPDPDPVSEVSSRLISNDARRDVEGDQVRWFNQAFQIIKSQLYIGAGFYDCLNPPASTHPSEQKCLIQIENGKAALHPAYTALSQAIALEDSHQAMISTDPEEIAIPFDPENFPKPSTP